METTAPQMNPVGLRLPEPPAPTGQDLTPRLRAKARWCKVKYSLHAIAASEAKTPTGADTAGNFFSLEGLGFGVSKSNAPAVRRTSLSSATAVKPSMQPTESRRSNKPAAAKSLRAALSAPVGN